MIGKNHSLSNAGRTTPRSHSKLCFAVKNVTMKHVCFGKCILFTPQIFISDPRGHYSKSHSCLGILAGGKRCPSHIQIYYSDFKDPTDIFSLSLNASHFLNQLDESICFECLLLAPVKDSPCAGNDCTLQCGYSVPRWFECIISIINTSVAFEDFFFVKQSSARSKSTVFPPFYLTACVMNMNSASTT